MSGAVLSPAYDAVQDVGLHRSTDTLYLLAKRGSELRLYPQDVRVRPDTE